MIELAPGLDFRRPELRREVFVRFYLFHLRHRAHPGGVYYALPYIVDRLELDEEQRAWLALLNGHTQNPVTTLLLLGVAPRPSELDALADFAHTNWHRLPWDTDRRHHRPLIVDSLRRFLDIADGDPWGYFTAAAEAGWTSSWEAATSVPTFGRLSAWSFVEYLRLVGVPVPDPPDLLLGDVDGSRSHRTGLCVVDGADLSPELAALTPTDDDLVHLDTLAAELLDDTRARALATGETWASDVGPLTIESALCTYKSWHKPRRRYPNVYNDMLHDRLRNASSSWADATSTLAVLWDARAAALPDELLLERNPFDPGVHPIKQDHYRSTGQVVMMDVDDPTFRNDFNETVRLGGYGRFR